MKKQHLILGLAGVVGVAMVAAMFMGGGSKKSPSAMPPPPQASTQPAEAEDQQGETLDAGVDEEFGSLESGIVSADENADTASQSQQDNGSSLSALANVPAHMSAYAAPSGRQAGDRDAERARSQARIAELEALIADLESSLASKDAACADKLATAAAKSAAPKAASQHSEAPRSATIIPGSVSLDGDTVLTGLRWTGPRPTMSARQVDDTTVVVSFDRAALGAALPSSSHFASVSRAKNGRGLDIEYRTHVASRLQYETVNNSVVMRFVPLYQLPVEAPWRLVHVSERAAIVHNRSTDRTVTVIPGSVDADLGRVRSVNPVERKVMTDIGFIGE